MAIRYRILPFLVAVVPGCRNDATVHRELTPEGPVVVNMRTTDDVTPGRLDPLWSHSGPEWGDPSGVAFNGRGRIAIVDGQRARIHRLTSGGSILSSIGERGDGPDEWAGVDDAIFQGDRLWVRPSRESRVELYDSAGRKIEAVEVGEPFTFLHADDSVLVGSPLTTSADFVVLDRLDQERALRFEVPQDRYAPEEYGECWRLAATGTALYRLSCAAGRVQVMDVRGGPVMWIELGDQPRLSTEDELDAFLERFWQLRSGGRALSPLISRQLQGVRERATVLPRYSLLRVDPVSGRLFLVEQPFGDYGVEDGILHVVAPDGEHVLRVPLARHVRDLQVYGDTLVMLVRHPSTDVVSVEVALVRR